jgi:hypothetical protein
VKVALDDVVVLPPRGRRCVEVRVHVPDVQLLEPDDDD